MCQADIFDTDCFLFSFFNSDNSFKIAENLVTALAENRVLNNALDTRFVNIVLFSVVVFTMFFTHLPSTVPM